ncbi:MAG: transcription termination factor Rho [Patescibacteria group bacterium]
MTKKDDKSVADLVGSVKKETKQDKKTVVSTTKTVAQTTSKASIPVRRNTTSRSSRTIGNNRGINGRRNTVVRRTIPQSLPDSDMPTETVSGIFDNSRDGHGVLRPVYSLSDQDIYISTSQIRRFRLRPGDVVEGPARKPKENERYWGLLQVKKVNGQDAEKLAETQRTKYYSLTPVYPDSQIILETGDEPLSTRIIDLVAPIGKGQRSLIVSPPKAGKTTLIKDIATGVAKNHPEMHIMAVLVGERPEEVTDIKRHIEKLTKGKGETAASNFDESPEEQCRVAELALERAKRLVETGQDVVILLDSITRLARGYNLAMPTSGRTLSGGFDPAALHPPKRFYGAARNFEVKGSLTIIGTALTDTGSRMDDLIYEEFKGTGNQEVHLDRNLAERRIYPAIDVQRSGTRRDDLLIDSVTYQSIITLQRMLDMMDRDERTKTLIERMKRHKSNKAFLASLKSGD